MNEELSKVTAELTATHKRQQILCISSNHICTQSLALHLQCKIKHEYSVNENTTKVTLTFG